LQREVDDKYLFAGPATYIPKTEEEVVQKLTAKIVLPHQALVLRALKDTVDASGKKHTAGQKWLHRIEGQFIPTPDVEIITTRKGNVLTD
jgi:major vault protein